MRFRWAGHLLYMPDWFQRQPLCGVGPKGGSSTGESPHHLYCIISAGSPQQTLASRQVCPWSLGLELLVTGFLWPPLLGWWRNYFSLQVRFSHALHGMSYLLKHWIQINFSTCCFVWSWLLQMGNANFPSSKLSLQELFVPFHPLGFPVEILPFP